jgi:hypothetical protein
VELCEIILTNHYYCFLKKKLTLRKNDKMIIKTSKIESTKNDSHFIHEIGDKTPLNEALSELLKQKIDEAIYSLDNNKGISNDLVMEETKNRYPKYF